MPKTKRKIPYVHERDGRMFVRVPYRAGAKWKTKERRVASTDEALRVIQELKEDLGKLGPEAFDGDKMPFDQLLKQYRHAYPDKPRWYVEPLAEYFGKRLIRTITYGDLKQFRAAREKVKKADGADRKPATINREVEQLRGVILYAVRHGWLRHNPFAAGAPLIHKSQEEKRKRVPSLAEEAAILATCGQTRQMLKMFLIATRDTGLRRGALLDLGWPDIDWEARLVRVPAGNAYKQRPDAIGLSARLHGELLRGWEADPDREGKIFRGQKDFKKAYATVCRLAGVEGLRMNDWRHGFATDLMEAGVAPHLAMKIAGHQNAEIHGIYTNVDDRLALSVAAALDQLHARRAGQKNADVEANEYVN